MSAAYAITLANGGWALTHNGKALNTPAGVPFVVPSEKLAALIAAEWNAQGKKPNPETMPLTQMAATCLDVVPKARAKIIAALARYAETDLLCHRAEQQQELADRQASAWHPMLEWCAQKFGATLLCGVGIMPVTQPADSLKKLERAVAAYDDWRLSGLQVAVETTGSLLLGLVCAEGVLDADKLFELAELDTTYQIEKWGSDPVTESSRAKAKRDIDACALWFKSL